MALALPALYLARGHLPLIQLIVVVAAGAIGYIGMIWLVERDSLMKLVEIVGFRRKAALPSDA
jgi:hypothetical protein